MKNGISHSFITFLLFLISTGVIAQQKDADTTQRISFFHNIFNQIKNTITVRKTDSAAVANLIITKSKNLFDEYEGKVIGSITIKTMGFEKTFTDTTRNISYYGTQLLNALHTDTHEWVIRDNLFIKVGMQINQYVMADNERHLRNLEFIQDARILVNPQSDESDTVDVVVVTKDLFSITGAVNFSGIDRQKVRVAENNLAGAGQKVQVTVLHDDERRPAFGYDFSYGKNSIAHTFINGVAGFSRINSDRTGKEDVEAFYLQLSRPLISPYSRLAGGLDIRFNRSKNLYNLPDSQFYQYKNSMYDGWFGYNIGLKKLYINEALSNRTFIAARYINNTFLQTPVQVGKQFNSRYNTIKALLTEITFFKQEFYKTNFIYGFGTTEDVPYGYNIAVTAGWYKQLHLSRPYLGINANRYITRSRGSVSQFYLRTGGFLYRKKLQDVSLLAGGSVFSRLFLFDHFKMRQYFRYSYTRIFNGITYDPLRINNALGLRHFSADSLMGNQRLSLYAETFFFAKYKLFGFQLAPFVFTDVSLLTGEGHSFNKSDIFTGIGGGLRTRNVNLIFGTTELRLMVFPRKAQEMNAFKVSVKTNIRFRYNSSYIKPPDIIQLNSDDVNSFY